jgi:hypothetical protein
VTTNMNYYLGVKTIPDAVDAIGQLSFIKVLDKAAARVQSLTNRITLVVGPASAYDDLSKGVQSIGIIQSREGNLGTFIAHHIGKIPVRQLPTLFHFRSFVVFRSDRRVCLYPFGQSQHVRGTRNIQWALVLMIFISMRSAAVTECD